MTFLSVEVSLSQTPNELAEQLGCRNMAALPDGIVAGELGDRVLVHVSKSTDVFKDIVLRLYGFEPSLNCNFDLPPDDTLFNNVIAIICALVTTWHKYGGEFVVLQNGDRAVMHGDSSQHVRLQSQSDFWRYYEAAIVSALNETSYSFESLANV